MVNWLATLVVSIVVFAFYMLWYGPLFGKQWMKGMKFTKKNMKMNKLDPLKGFIALFIFTAILDYMIGAGNFVSGMFMGILVWVLLTMKAYDAILWEKKSKVVFVINIFANLITIVASAGVLAIW